MSMSQRCATALVATLVLLVLPTSEGFVAPHLMVPACLLQSTNPQGRVMSIPCGARNAFSAGSLFSPADGGFETEQDDDEEQGPSLGAKVFAGVMLLPFLSRIFSALPVAAAQPQPMELPQIATDNVVEEQIVDETTRTNVDLDELEDEDDEFDLGVQVDMDGDEDELSMMDKILNKLTDKLEQLDESFRVNENSQEIAKYEKEMKQVNTEIPGKKVYSIPPYATKEQADLIASGIEPRLVIPRVSVAKVNPFERMRKSVATHMAVWFKERRKGDFDNGVANIKDILPDPVRVSRQIHDRDYSRPSAVHPAFTRIDDGWSQGPSEQFKRTVDLIGYSMTPLFWVWFYRSMRHDEKESRRKSLIALEKFKKEKARLFPKKDDDDDKPKKPSGGGGDKGGDGTNNGDGKDGKKGGGTDGGGNTSGGSGSPMPPGPEPERSTPQDTEESGDDVIDILDSL